MSIAKDDQNDICIERNTSLEETMFQYDQEYISPIKIMDGSSKGLNIIVNYDSP